MSSLLKISKKILLGRYFIFCAVFAVGFYVGHLKILNNEKTSSEQDIAPFREKTNNSKFINPLLFYDVPKGNNAPKYRVLTDQIQKITDDFKRQNVNNQLSIYYRDLNQGQWVGINEDQAYTPSSLLKVAILIVYLKEMEIQPALGEHAIRFSKEIQQAMSTIPYEQETELEIDHQYSVNDLLNRMIGKSDNGATYSLLSQIDDSQLDKIFANLGLQNPKNTGRSYVITPESYVSFLRILYNATYLNRAMSEKALELLSRTTFKDGLVAGIPKNIPISHKYGETVATVANGKDINFIELHDCGIIYHPQNPYILCVMSRGNDLNRLATSIKTVSAIVYQFANSN